MLRTAEGRRQELHGGRWARRIFVGYAVVLAIACVDNFAFNGEVSPIVIVAMLFAGTATAGVVWGRHAWLAAAGMWLWIPLVHLVKHVLKLPDTMHPNTYVSIMLLPAFTLLIASIATGCGQLVHRGNS